VTTSPPGDNPFAPPGYDARTASAGSLTRSHWFSGPVRILLVAGVLAGAALGVAGAFGLDRLSLSTAPGVGDCLYLTRDDQSRQTYHRAGCSARQATYKVDGSRTGDGLCGFGDYVRFQVLRPDGGTDRTLCLALNVSTGDCLRNVEDETTIAKAGCGDPGVEERVQVIDGGSAECGAKADKSLTYSGPPPRTVCLLAPGESI
jgi:hypothetical protein